MILVLDNYDSFTWNLVHYLRELGSEVEVHRNDQLTVEQAMVRPAAGLLISPGPRTPDEAGITLDLVRAAAAARAARCWAYAWVIRQSGRFGAGEWCGAG